MRPTFKYVSISKAKDEFLEIIRQVEKQDGAIALTKKGVPTAIVLSMKRFEGLLETLDILGDENTMRALKTAIRQARKARWVSYERVFGR